MMSKPVMLIATLLLTIAPHGYMFVEIAEARSDRRRTVCRLSMAAMFSGKRIEECLRPPCRTATSR